MIHYSSRAKVSPTVQCNLNYAINTEVYSKVYLSVSIVFTFINP